MTTFLLGVGASLVAALLLWVGRRSVRFLLSSIQARLWHGRNVSGKWTAKYSKDGSHFLEQAVLRQLGHSVTGTIENHELNRRYTVHGSIRAGVLVATYEIDSKSDQIDRGAFVLVVNLEGDEMAGHYSWIDSAANAVRRGAYEWKKVLDS